MPESTEGQAVALESTDCKPKVYYDKLKQLLLLMQVSFDLISYDIFQ